MHIILHALFLLAAWKWGDWRNWQKYYSTVLYLIVNDQVYNFLTYNYPLWKFNAVTFDKIIYSNHTLITLGIDFINYPAIVLIYLGHYPKGKIKQAVYVSAWALLNSAIEITSLATVKGISHANGWNLGWSIVVNFLYYILLRVHYLRPLLAWAFSIGLIVVFSILFSIPIRTMK